jgi:hypothetical protein
LLRIPDLHSDDETIGKTIITHPKSFMSDLKGLKKLKAHLKSKFTK